MIDWDDVGSHPTVESVIDKLMRIWEINNPQLVRLMGIMSMSQEKDTRYSDLLTEMKTAMAESGFDKMLARELKCVVALRACSDETMLCELLRDYDNTWMMEGIIDKVRKLEKCTVIVHDFAPYSANSIYRRGGNMRGRTCGRGDRG